MMITLYMMATQISMRGGHPNLNSLVAERTDPHTDPFFGLRAMGAL